MPSLPRRAGFGRGLILALAGMLCALPLRAAESPRAFPLWDGKESVESYAARVKMPSTKSIDLGGGVTLDLVLIPAGQFMMGSAEPAKPTISAAGASFMFAIGLCIALHGLDALTTTILIRRRVAFSLRWLLLMSIASGFIIGAVVRWQLAERDHNRYEAAMIEYNKLPANEKPGRLVTLTQPFYMGKYTVTQEQYEAVTASNPSRIKGAQFPVEQVSWNDATEFCRKLNGLQRSRALKARLPTEAQWEYACRAGTQTLYYSGNQKSDLDAVAWTRSNSSDKPHPVGLKKPNAFGLYDMHGHVFQWCEDAYADHYDELILTDPVNAIGDTRVSRGGSWRNIPEDSQSAFRHNDAPDHRFFLIGFRVVLVTAIP